MAGRKRRAASDSPVEPLGHVKPSVRHYRESTILKPVSLTAHIDDWPCFLLSEATVHRPDGRPLNQLHVDLDGPSIIRGKLEVEKDNEQYLVNRHMKKRTLWIQIESSNAFSVGAKDDSLSVPVVWASGAAGWFEIVPAASYRTTCENMYQGVCLHYALLDQYESALEKARKLRRKKKSAYTFADVNLDLDELLFQYALRVGDGLTLPEAYTRLDDQSTFLLSHFPKDTNLYKYLAEKHHEKATILVNKVLKPAPQHTRQASGLLKAYDYSDGEQSSSLEIAGVKKKGKGFQKKSASRSARNSAAPDAGAAGLADRRSKKRSPAEAGIGDHDILMIDSSNSNPTLLRTPRDHRIAPSRESPIVPTAGSSTESSVQVLIGALEDVRKNLLQQIRTGEHKRPITQFTAKSWQTKVYLECAIKAYGAVPEIFHYYARDLLQLMDSKWHDSQIYQWLTEKASEPVSLTMISETEIKHIARRIKMTARAKRLTEGVDVGNVVPEDPRPEARAYAGKQTPRNRQSGKAAGLRPSTGGKKRVRLEADYEDITDSDEDGLMKKKSKTSHYFTGDENDDDDNDDDDNHENLDEDDTDSPSGNKTVIEKQLGSVAQLVIRAEKLPTTRPQGPNQTWICEEPDCGFLVRAAHEEHGQQLVNAHQEEHEKEAQDVAQEMALTRVNLAVQEANRGRMPINHLLEKIRNIGEKSNHREEAVLDGHAVPKPIKRTLFV